MNLARQFSTCITAFWLLVSYAVNAQEKIPVVTKGSIKRFDQFPSKYITARNVDVWLPEGYDPLKKYDVLYMHDGQMLFDSSMTWNGQEWGVDEIVSALLEQKKIRPLIVVGIWNGGAARHAEYCPQKPMNNLIPSWRDSVLTYARRKDSSIIFRAPLQADAYLSFIVRELKPYIDRTYSTNPGRSHTFIGGSSMGGMISLYAICEYPDVFGGAACLSTHWTVLYSAQNNLIPASMMEYLSAHLPDPKQHKIYFDFGTTTLDTLYEQFQVQVDRLMLKKGFRFSNWRTAKYPGEEHSEAAWRRRLATPLRFLVGK